MADRAAAGQNDCAANIREAVCINTEKIFDSCKDKDCVDDLRVYPTVPSQAYIENALSIRPRSAELLYVDVSVDTISFNRGYYTVDCTYFYKVTGEAFPSGALCTGLCIFDKRVMLFGSEGSVKTFASDATLPIPDSDELPRATVSCVEPLCLNMRLIDLDVPVPADAEARRIPDFITRSFADAIDFTDTARRWLTTIGQFSIIRLTRATQILVPAYDYCMPDKECPGASEDDPCSLFSRIRFPVEEFFPPDTVSQCDDYKTMQSS